VAAPSRAGTASIALWSVYRHEVEVPVKCGSYDAVDGHRGVLDIARDAETVDMEIRPPELRARGHVAESLEGLDGLVRCWLVLRLHSASMRQGG
jgi:hypothetical protein